MEQLEFNLNCMSDVVKEMAADRQVAESLLIELDAVCLEIDEIMAREEPW